MFKRILFPTVGSALSEKIAKIVVGLIKEDPDRHVVILNVYQEYPLPGIVESEMNSKGLSAEEVIRDNVKNVISKAIKVFKDNGIPYEVLIKEGQIAKTITDTADKMDMDLMIIGYHGEKASLGDYIFKGNIMTQIIDEARCPVMVIK